MTVCSVRSRDGFTIPLAENAEFSIPLLVNKNSAEMSFVYVD